MLFQLARLCGMFLNRVRACLTCELGANVRAITPRLISNQYLLFFVLSHINKNRLAFSLSPNALVEIRQASRPCVPSFFVPLQLIYSAQLRKVAHCIAFRMNISVAKCMHGHGRYRVLGLIDPETSVMHFQCKRIHEQKL